MSKEIYVLDIETDNLDYRLGSILEIGIVKLNFDSGEIVNIFSSLVQEEKKIDPNAWIFKNSSLNFLDLIVAPALNHLYGTLQNIFSVGSFTAFNQDFDFKWLESRNFDILNKFLDPMKVLTPVMKLRHRYYNYKYPNVEEAYLFLFKEKIVEEHRALSDAIIEAKILLKMYQNELF